MNNGTEFLNDNALLESFHFCKNLKISSDKSAIILDTTDDGIAIWRFDTGKLDCHLLLHLDADIPRGTQINIYYYISKNEEEIFTDSQKWRKSCFNYHSSGLDPIIPIKNHGRFLWVKVELISSEDGKTPTLKFIKLSKKTPYLDYLPAIYQEDKYSKDFLERFLAIFETFFYNSEEKIKNVHKYFDPDETPPKFLSWLAEWTSTVLDDTWSEEKKRKFLKRAVGYYKIKGTKKGIEELVELYTGITPLIIENWQLYSMTENGLKLKYEFLNAEYEAEMDNQGLKEENLYRSLLGIEKAFSFHVIIPPPFILSSKVGNDIINDEKKLFNEVKDLLSNKKIYIPENLEIQKLFEGYWVIKASENFYIRVQENPEDNILTIYRCFNDSDFSLDQKLKLNRLINMEKPLHTLGQVIILKKGFTLGHHILGINTFLRMPES